VPGLISRRGGDGPVPWRNIQIGDEVFIRGNAVEIAGEMGVKVMVTDERGRFTSTSWMPVSEVAKLEDLPDLLLREDHTRHPHPPAWWVSALVNLRNTIDRLVEPSASRA
jgi:hypothetical protein